MSHPAWFRQPQALSFFKLINYSLQMLLSTNYIQNADEQFIDISTIAVCIYYNHLLSWKVWFFASWS